MNCSRVRRSLPLLAGKDLPAGKARRVEKHLEKCPGCRQKIEEIRATLAGVRAIADRTSLDWPEADWRRLMARVKSESPKPRLRPLLLPGLARRSWAYAAATVLVLSTGILVLRIVRPRSTSAMLEETATSTPAQPGRALGREQALLAFSPLDRPFRVYADRKSPKQVMLAAGPVPGKPAQEMMSMTLVSQKTGLQVHWTWNRNFEWEEKKK